MPTCANAGPGRLPPSLRIDAIAPWLGFRSAWTPRWRQLVARSFAGDIGMTDGAIDGGNVELPMLFQPFAIRGLTLKNRLVVPPMVHYRCDPGNTCGAFHLVHLGRYALGGFGLVFVEATAVEEVGLA